MDVHMFGNTYYKMALYYNEANMRSTMKISKCISAPAPCAAAFRLTAMLVLSVLILSSCSGRPTVSEITDVFDRYAGENGGNVITIDRTMADSDRIPDAFVSLYGCSDSAPDELSLIEYGVIWYSNRPDGGDAAVFKAVNASDAESLKKMCERRALTLKRSAQTDSEIFIVEHFVCFIAPKDPNLRKALFSEVEG